MNDEKKQDSCLLTPSDAATEQFVEISKKWTFDAAHHLPNHVGKCRNEHGHTYTVEVSVSGPVQPERGRSDDGMVLDFADLSQVWKTSVEPLLDHQNLNESIGKLGCWPTTAENIVRWIGETFEKNGIAITSVSLWETPTSRATTRWRMS